MIEVEKKFAASESDIERITKDAEFISDTVNKDSYYDREGFPLVKNNIFLRKRNGRFELKLYVAEEGSRVDKYLEVEDDETIKSKLNIPAHKDISEYLAENEYFPFGSWKTNRRRFKKNGFTIDVDSVDFSHNVVEVELMVEEGGDTEEAANRILNFAKVMGLEEDKQEGKVMVFIKRANLTAYEEIKAAWASKLN